MADRRMMTKKVTDDDRFMLLSSSAQALYLHLSMSADDDGFSNQVTIAMFKAHASVQDLQALLENRYIYQFDNGVIVIRHWRMANALRKDRYTPTIFKEELANLQIDDTGAYEMNAGNQMATIWQPNGNQMATQDRIDKDKSDKDRSGEGKKTARFAPPTLEEVTAYCQERGNNIDPQHFIDYYQMNGWKVGGKTPMKDWKAAVRTWEQREKEKQAAQPAPRQAAPARPAYQKKPNFFNDYTHDYSHGAPDWDAIQSQMETEPVLKFAKS